MVYLMKQKIVIFMNISKYNFLMTRQLDFWLWIIQVHISFGRNKTLGSNMDIRFV